MQIVIKKNKKYKNWSSFWFIKILLFWINHCLNNEILLFEFENCFVMKCIRNNCYTQYDCFFFQIRIVNFESTMYDLKQISIVWNLFLINSCWFETIKNNNFDYLIKLFEIDFERQNQSNNVLDDILNCL